MRAAAPTADVGTDYCASRLGQTAQFNDWVCGPAILIVIMHQDNARCRRATGCVWRSQSRIGMNSQCAQPESITSLSLQVRPAQQFMLPPDLVVAYIIITGRLLGGAWARIVGNSDGSRWHNRRYRMLIDHLTDTVPQQYYKGIKRLDLALQFNPVNKVHRNRDSFFSQYIEEGVLQCCPSLYWHFISPLLIYLLL